MDQRPALIALLQETRRVVQAQQELGIECYPLSAPLKKFLNRPGSPRVTPVTRPASRPVVDSTYLEMPPGIREREMAPEGPERGPESLAEIRAPLASCTRCPLAAGRERIVFGRGGAPARLMITGDWPTAADEAADTPFSGEEGVLLSKMLQAIKLDPAEVYLTTVVKCRAAAPGPTVEEVKRGCLNILLAQIGAVAPKVILAMGTLAAQTLFASTQPLSRLRGRTQPYLGRLLLATYPPAYLLKNPEMKAAAWTDLQLLQKKLAE